MATDLRAIVFQALRADPEIGAAVSDRIIQRASPPSGVDDQEPPLAQLETPYLVYALSDDAPTGPSAMNASRRYIMVWVHDQPGDYGTFVDPLIHRTKPVMLAVPQQGKLMEIRWLGNSPDLYDDLLKHIVRYSRFYATLTE